MRRYVSLAGVVLVALAASPPAALADPISFKLLPRNSSAAFKTDAPLETVIGHTADAGIQGELTVDPAEPQMARGMVKVDMHTVRTGVDKRDADMRARSYLDTDVEANRWVTFDVKKVEIVAPLDSGKAIPVKIHGLLTVKQMVVQRVADGTVTYIKLSPEQLEAQKRFGLTSDNIKVRAKLATTFTDHGMQIPHLLLLKLSNDIGIETDLTFVRQ